MFSFLKGLGKTKDKLKEVKNNQKIDKNLLEEILLEADVDYELVEEIIYYLPPQQIVKFSDLQRVLQAYFIYEKEYVTKEAKPFVDLVFGVNGAGKTTTIAKLANIYKQQNKTVMLGASDTFRAAAIEQLSRWAKQLDVPIIATKQGHDPSAVAYDTIISAKAKNIDHVLIDTAGRLSNQQNLANELSKIIRICDKAMPNAPHRKLLILDGTQGTSALLQAKAFHEIAKVDAIIITKLDGSAKGGSLFSIARALELPILYIGVGEKMQDLIAFDAKYYIDQLLGDLFEK